MWRPSRWSRMSFNSRSHTVEDLFSGAVRLIILSTPGENMLRSRSILDFLKNIFGWEIFVPALRALRTEYKTAFNKVSRVNADYWPLFNWSIGLRRGSGPKCELGNFWGLEKGDSFARKWLTKMRNRGFQPSGFWDFLFLRQTHSMTSVRSDGIWKLADGRWFDMHHYQNLKTRP